jgi:hypothetical protein
MALSPLPETAITWVGPTLKFYTAYPPMFLISAVAVICYLAAVAGLRFANANPVRR